MIVDNEGQRKFWLDLLNSSTLPGHLVEYAFGAKQALRTAKTMEQYMAEQANQKRLEAEATIKAKQEKAGKNKIAQTAPVDPVPPSQHKELYESGHR